MSTLDLDGMTLYYELAGPPGGEPIVFVNGLLTDAASWGAIVPAFSDHYRCLVYDARGQGRSDAPASGPYTPAIHAADLDALTARLELQPAVFVGLSSGGATILRLAVDRPEAVRALVVADTYAYTDPLLRLKLRSWLAAMACGGSGLRFEIATPWVWGASFVAAHEDLLDAWRDRASALREHAVRLLIEGAIEHDVRDRLSDVRAPALVVVGEEDLLTPPVMARQIARLLPEARLEVLPGAGHASALERPDEFATLARRFIDGVHKRPLRRPSTGRLEKQGGKEP